MLSKQTLEPLEEAQGLIRAAIKSAATNEKPIVVSQLSKLFMDIDKYRYFSEIITHWYDQNARDLPWRRTKDPYKIWISEIMLQQTQVTTVRDYYLRWVKRFPTIQSVSRSSMDEVLKYWEGLGYYSRVRNFHASCEILDSQGSTVPKGVE